MLNQKEVTIKTATVEVKTLSISGKQVTQSVFRQIQEGPLIDWVKLETYGNVWGWVNYYWGNCAKDAQHLHVVWQLRQELRRTCVYPHPQIGDGKARFGELLDLTKESLESYADYALIAGDKLIQRIEQYSLSFQVGRQQFSIFFDDIQRNIVYDLFHPEYGAPDKRQLAKLIERLPYSQMTPKEYWHTEVQPHAQKLANFVDQYKILYDAIASTDHLFIAV